MIAYGLGLSQSQNLAYNIGAQSPIDGGSSTPVPLQIPGYITWQDGQDPNGNGIVPANGSSISTWVDKTKNGFNLGTASGGVAATYATNSLNTRPTVTFNGSTQYLSYAKTLLQQFDGKAGSTICMVARTNSYNPPEGILFSTIPYVQVMTCGSTLPYFADDNVYWDFGDFTNGGRTSANWGTTTGVANIWTFGQVANTHMNIWRNQTNIVFGATGSAAGFGNVYNLTVGAGEATYFWHGDIAEIIIYDHELTSAERTLLWNYLKVKWGL